MTRGETAKARALVLNALEPGPLSAREICTRLRKDRLVQWAEENGVDLDPDNVPPPVRLLALIRAREIGMPTMMAQDIDRHLRFLEKRGLVSRIQLEGHRPMLWRLAGTS